METVGKFMEQDWAPSADRPIWNVDTPAPETSELHQERRERRGWYILAVLGGLGAAALWLRGWRVRSRSNG